MPNVDEKVVKMTFENRQFEQAVEQSKKTIDDLKKALSFEKAMGELSGLKSAFKGFDLSKISDNIEDISSKFTLLGQVGMKAMDKIATSAVNAGTSILKSISVDQISAGMGKYETQTKAVQTIKNATGKSVEEVESVLDTLMKYTDETSYDFVEMANSIGKFTSVGVDLEMAEKAMEGIANEAALSGAGKAEANRAMYNFAQALSAGYVKLIDWKSIENANMATKEFKEELIKTAIELGTLNQTGEATGSIMKMTKKATSKAAAEYKETTVDFKSFNETLSEGWLTSDVLITTLNRYADTSTDLGQKAFWAAQKALTFSDAMDAIKDAVSSGWMQSFQLLFGNLDESIELWTNFCNAIIEVTSEVSEYRNEILQVWHDGQGDGPSGYLMMIEAISNVWETFVGILHAAKEAIASVIPPTTGEDLINATEKIRDATENLKNFFHFSEGIDVEEEVKRVESGFKSIKHTLSKGSEKKGSDYSSQIKALQKGLIAEGYLSDKSMADGIYGPKTEEAVKKLQKDLGVSQTGIWDKATKKAANDAKIYSKIVTDTKTVHKNAGETYKTTKYYARELNHAKEMRSVSSLSEIELNKKLGEEEEKRREKDIKYVQQKLIKMGYLDKGQADGIYGPKTKEAMKAFQKDLGIAQTGYWGKEEVNAAGNWDNKKFIEMETATKQVTETVEGSSPAMEDLQRIIAGVTSAFDILANYIHAVYVGFSGLFDAFKEVGEALFIVGAAIGEMLTNLGKTNKQTDAYAKFAENLYNKLMPIANAVKSFANAISRAVTAPSKPIKSFYDLILNLARSIDDFFMTFRQEHPDTPEAFKVIIDIVGALWHGLRGLAEVYQKVVRSFAHRFGDPNKTFLSKIFSALNIFRYVVGTVFKNIYKALKKSPIFGPILEQISPVIDLIASLWAGFKQLTKLLPDLANRLSKIFGDPKKTFVQKIASAFKLLKIVIWKTLKAIVKRLKKSSFWGPIVEKISLIIDVVKKVFDFISGIVRAIQKLDIIGKIKKAIGWSESKTIAENFTQMLNQMKNGIIGFKTKIEEFISGLLRKYPVLGAIYKFIKDVIGKVKRFVFDDNGKFVLFDNLKKKFNELKQKIKELPKTIKQWIKDSVNKAKDKLDELKEKFPILQTLADKFAVVKKALEDIGTYLNEHIFSKLGWDDDLSFTENLINNFEALKAGIAEVIDDIALKIETFREEHPAIDAFLTHLESAASTIRGFIAAIVESIQNLLSPDDGEGNEEGSLFDRIKNKLETAFQPLIKWFEDTKQKIVDFWNSLFNPGEDVESDGEKANESLLQKITKFFSGLDLGKIIPSILGGLAAYVIVKLVKNISSIAKGFENIAEAFKNRNKKDDDNESIGTTALKIAAAVAIITAAVAALAFIPADKAMQGAKAFAVVVAIMSVAIIAVNKFGGKGEILKNIGVLFAGIGIGVFLLVLSVIKIFNFLKTIKPKDMPKLYMTLGIIGGLIVALGVIAVLIAHFSKGGEENKGIPTILALCVGVLVLTFALAKVTKLINEFGGDDVMGAFGMIMGLVIALGAIVVLTAAFSENGQVKIKGLLLACVGIYVLVMAMKKVTKLIHEYGGDVGGAFAMVISLLVVLGAIIVLTGAFGTEGKALAAGGGILIACIGICFILEALAKALNSMRGVDPELAKVVMIGLVAIITVAGLLAALLGKLGLGAALSGAVGLLAILLVLSAGIALLANAGAFAVERFRTVLWGVGSTLEDVDKMTSGLDIDKMKSVFKMLKDDVVSAIVRVSTNYTNFSKAAEAGWKLEDFGISLETFYECIKDFDSDKIKLVEELAQSALDAANIVEQIGDAVDLGSKLLNLGSGLKLYYNSIVNFDSSKAQAAKDIAQSAKDAFDIASGIESGYDIAARMMYLGSGLKLYYNSVSSFESSKAEVAKDIAQSAKDVFDIASGIESGFDIASRMTYLGSGLKLYYNSVSGFEPENVSDATAIAENASELFTKLSAFSDSTLIKAITDNVTDVGAAMELYYNMLAGINTKDEEGNDIEVDPETIKKVFTVLNESAPDTDIVHKIESFAPSGENDLTDFALGITKIGAAIKGYGDDISGLDTGKVTTANTALEGIGSVWSLVTGAAPSPEEETEISGYSDGEGNSRFTAFTLGITALGTAIKGYGEDISGINSGEVTTANSVLESIGDIWTLVTTAAPTDDQEKQISAYGEKGDNKGLTAFALGITALGTAIQGYAEDISGINSEEVATANDVLDKVEGIWTKLSNAAPDEDVQTDIGKMQTGNKSFDAFVLGITGLGTALGTYGKDIGSLKVTQINLANRVMDKVYDLKEKLREGGLLNSIMDFFRGKRGNLISFGNDIQALGKSIKKYGDSVTGIKQKDITNGEKVITIVKDLNEGLPRTGAIWEIFTGTKSLDGFAQGLGDIGKGVKNFCDNIKDADYTHYWSALSIVTNVADVFNGLSKSGGLAAVVAGDKNLSNLTANLGQVGSDIKLFADNTKDIPDTYTAAGAVAALSGLAGVAKEMPEAGGLIQSFRGEKSLEGFGDDIKSVGEGITSFYTNTKDIPDTYTAAGAVAALTGLVDVSKKLPEAGGVVQKIFGENGNFGTFGDDLEAVGKGLNNFYTQTKDIPDNYKNSGGMAVVTGLAALSDALPESGGIVQKFTGENMTLDEFGDNISVLGTKLNEFYNATKDIKVEKNENGEVVYDIMGIVAVVDALAEVESHLETKGGAFDWLTGTKNLSDFADQIGVLGTNLALFNDNIQGIETVDNADGEKVIKNSEAMIAILNSLNDFQKNITTRTEIGKWFKGDNSITAFSGEVKTLGENLKQFDTDTKDINTDKLNSIVTAMETLGNAVTGLQNIWVISNSPLSLEEFIQNNFGDPDNTIDYSPVENVSKNVIDHLAKGLTDNKETPINAFSKDIKQPLFASLLLMWKDSRWYSAGKYICEGLEKGINEYAHLVDTAVENLAKKSIKVTMETFDEHSPSKKFQWIGEMADKGLIAGLESYSGNVESASEDVSKGALDVAKRGIAAYANTILSDETFQPRIRPVVDLSNVEEGSRSINRMFGSNKIPLGSISATTSGKLSNRIVDGEYARSRAGKLQNFDTLSKAVQELSGNVNDLGSRVSNMQMVTETGALVGQITNKMDRSLGRRAMLGRRLN